MELQIHAPANALNLIPPNDNAFGNQESAKIVFKKLSEYMDMPYEQIANQIIDISVAKIESYILPMLKDYKLTKNKIIVVGGGGGASVLVPSLAQKLGFQYKKADYADVISSIGVATGMIYEERERTINNPMPEDVTSLINEVKNEAILKNASPESLSVQSEYINERSILRVTAFGNITLDLNSMSTKEYNDKELAEIANGLIIQSNKVILEHNVGNYHIFSNAYQQKKLLFKIKKQSILVLDKFGKLRLSLDNGKIIRGNSEEISKEISNIVTEFSKNADLSPHIHLIDGYQILDFSSLNSNKHVVQAIREQLDKINSDVLLIIKQ